MLLKSRYQARLTANFTLFLGEIIALDSGQYFSTESFAKIIHTELTHTRLSHVRQS
ncbi:hypothetical protein Q4Q52_14060 [Shewanella sp. SP1S2-4]|uniref:hypothetical protein n=1 Tax=Shewanella TaxID=22 RepID=UPI00288FB67E|nr:MULTISPECIES: hypothetical protein [unclassified Shewanella]MDT3308944.1 hypothetical protein [Shewanella sp. SP1S1-4]MDT3320878.1 hypothetical protein [Shewanella sp. SP1S2-4]